ncbi:C-Maf-inducing protein [Bombyx mori]|uniref:C-Maf-inducing protein PH domain-containing protein n=2 Tax=Bombyx TaxID=7090 RepID=A0A8R1WJI4_BOMMO|nr:C-Maf-inducing protein [Bombyx mori]
MNFLSHWFFKMPSFSQDKKVDMNSNENDALNNEVKDEANGTIQEKYISSDKTLDSDSTPPGLNADQRLAFALRDFLGSSNTVLSDEASEGEPSPSAMEKNLPFIDEFVDPEVAMQSDEEIPQCRETEEVLNNAACRLRRWRAASRKLRRPRIINNLCSTDEKESNINKLCNGGHTDLADRLRSLAAVGNMSASAGELLSLAPPPPAATAPPSPGCLLSPTLAEQNSEYFGSSPECCADNAGQESSAAGAPVPPPGPRYKLATEGALRVCCFQHTRTVVDKILAAKFLRRWETHVLRLEENHIVSKTPAGLLESPLSYSCMQEVYCISRWDPARKYCLRIVMPHGSLLLQANDAYTRDQWYHSIIWRRNIIRYRNFLTKTVRKEVVLKELKNMVDFVMTTPLQDESVTRAPLLILTDLISENKESADWEEWAENLTNVAAPLLAERCATGELCASLARLCRQRPRAAPLPALAPPVRRVLTRNVDFARAPNARRLVRDYISALSAHNSGSSLVRRFVEVTHGNRAACPYPRAAPNLAAVALAALDDFFRNSSKEHECNDAEEEVLCFVDILEHMCEYEDWLVVVGAVLQPVPLCSGALNCPRVASRLGNVLYALVRDSRCAAHSCVAPARAARLYPPSWLRAAAPSDPLLAIPNKQLCQLWGDMLGALLNCCCKRKSFLQSMSKQLPDFVIVALCEHKAALDALCLMLEWEVASGEQTQLEIIAALQGTNSGQKSYSELCDRQKNLQRLQAKGGPRRLALPMHTTDADVTALLEQGSLGNLECLSLAFTSVTSACAQDLIKLPSLRYLNLWATKFGDTGLQLIAEHLTELQVLNLCETPVSDKGIEALSGLSNLRRLNLNSTKLSAEAFEVLRDRLPQLQEYDIRYTEAW